MKKKISILLILIALLIMILFRFIYIKNSNNNNFQMYQSSRKDGIKETERIKKTERLDIFKQKYPDAEIISESTEDIDNDNEDDLIIIFCNPITPVKSTKSNVCIMTSIGMNTVDLAGGDEHYQFVEGPDSLSILEEPKRISIILYDTKNDKKIDFQLTITTDKETKKTNIKIQTSEINTKLMKK